MAIASPYCLPRKRASASLYAVEILESLPVTETRLSSFEVDLMVSGFFPVNATSFESLNAGMLIIVGRGTRASASARFVRAFWQSRIKQRSAKHVSRLGPFFLIHIYDAQVIKGGSGIVHRHELAKRLIGFTHSREHYAEVVMRLYQRSVRCNRPLQEDSSLYQIASLEEQISGIREKRSALRLDLERRQESGQRLINLGFYADGCDRALQGLRRFWIDQGSVFGVLICRDRNHPIGPRDGPRQPPRLNHQV